MNENSQNWQNSHYGVQRSLNRMIDESIDESINNIGYNYHLIV